MTTVPTNGKIAPPPPPPPKRAAPAGPQPSGPLTFRPVAAQGKRIGLYGTGGIGKTTLACNMPGRTAFFDLDNSLHILLPQLPEDRRNQIQIVNADDWDAIRNSLHATGWDGIDNIVIDTGTKGEDLALAWTLKNVPHEKGNKIERIEDYGFGKGYRHLYDVFCNLLADLDTHARAGRNVVLVCHELTATVPNPTGDDYLRWEPRLQHNDKNSIRSRVKEWVDHLLFIGYDVVVKDSVGQGSGTRTVYPVERPFCMAKSRTLSQAVPLKKDDTEIWNQLLG